MGGRRFHRSRVRPEVAIRANLSSAGGPILQWWEPRPEHMTLVGSSITQWGSRLVTGANLVIDTGSATYSLTGGPAGRPIATLDTAGSNMIAPNLGIASGNRTALYSLAAPVLGAGALRLFSTLRINNLNSSTVAVNQGVSAADQARTFAMYSAGTNETVTETAALSAGFRLFATRPKTGATSFTINGVESSPTFVAAGAAGPALTTVGSYQFGHASLAGGSLAMVMLVDVSNAQVAANVDLLIRWYVSQYFNLPC